MEVSCQFHGPAALSPYSDPLLIGWVHPRASLEYVEKKLLLLPGIEPLSFST
jgi:hypothetical protein